VRPDLRRWLHQLLYPLLLIWYAFVVTGLVAVVATWPSRPIGALAEIPWWSHLIALVVVVLTWAPVSAQLDPPGAAELAIPLVHHDLALGTLRVSARRRLDRLSATDVRLLEDLARQVAITLHAARLSEAVQDSREQLVAAREEERRRIRRDLHDGLAPTLASLGLRLDVLRRTLRDDPAGAERLAGELRDDVRQATGEIRRLVYALRPPMLDELGLVEALRHLHPMDGLTRTVSMPEPAPALPAAVEVAVYRIAAEALHNAARHARAAHCAVELTVAGGTVRLTVSDDGRGLPDGYLAGVGHRSMRERAVELGGTIEIGPAPGGGTRVDASFPMRTR
jgi:two-component system NarL family sensor kinase